MRKRASSRPGRPSIPSSPPPSTPSTTAETQAKGAQTGVKEAGELAMRFAERNIASSFDFAQKLVQAKDPQEVMALHAEYTKSQIAALTEQAKELGEKATKMAGQGSH